MNGPTTDKDHQQYLCIPIKFNPDVMQTWSVKIPLPRLPCLRGQIGSKKKALPLSITKSSAFHASKQDQKCEATHIAPVGNTANAWTMWRIAAREHIENRYRNTLESSALTPHESAESSRSNSVPRSFFRTDSDKTGTADNVRLSLGSNDSELDRQRRCGSPESGIDCDDATSPCLYVAEGSITEQEEPFSNIGANLEVAKSEHSTQKSFGKNVSKSRPALEKVSGTCSTNNTNAVPGNSTEDADLPVALAKNSGASKPCHYKDIHDALADTKMADVRSSSTPTETCKCIVGRACTAKAPRALGVRTNDVHMEAERGRREAMRVSFEALRNVLPGLKVAEKSPKVLVLGKARELCILLQKVETTLLIKKARLTEHKECLIQRLSDMAVTVDGSGENKTPASPTSVPSPASQDDGKYERLMGLSPTDHSYSSSPKTSDGSVVPSLVATPLKCIIADAIDKLKPNPQSQLSSFRKSEEHTNVVPPNLRTEEEVDVVGLDGVVTARDLLKQGCARWTEETADSYDIADDLCIVSVRSLAPEKSAAGKKLCPPKGSDESLPNCSRLYVRKEESPKHGLKRVLVVDADYAYARPLPPYILEPLPRKKCHLDLNIEPLPGTSLIPHRQKQSHSKSRIRPRGIAQMKLHPRVGLSFRKHIGGSNGLSFRNHIGGSKHFGEVVYQHRERTPLKVERFTNHPTVKKPECKETDFSQDEELKSLPLVAEEAKNQVCNGDGEDVFEGVVVEEVDCEPPFPYSDADLIADDEVILASDSTFSVDTNGLESASNVQMSPLHGSLSGDEQDRLDLVDGTDGVGLDADSELSTDQIRFNLDWQVDANCGSNDLDREVFEPLAELKKNVCGENRAVAFGNSCENIPVNGIPAERLSEAAMIGSAVKPSEEVLLSADVFDEKNRLSHAVDKKEEFLRCRDVLPVVSLERIVIPLGTRLAPDVRNEMDEVFDFDETGHFYESPPGPHTVAIPSDVNNVSDTAIARKETSFADSRLGSSPMDRISELRKKLRQKEADLEKVRENLISLADVPLE